MKIETRQSSDDPPRPRRVIPRPEVLLTGAKARAAGVNPDGLSALAKRAARTRSVGLYVSAGGRVVAERYFGQPQAVHPIMSVTKPVVALLLLRLRDRGEIRSLDQPVSDFYGLWKRDARRARVTLRHLLTHTSGISTETSPENNAWRDIYAFSLAQPMKSAPGSRWEYNNFAFYLLGDILRKASGQQAYDLAKPLFASLAISDFSWRRDGAGNADTAGGLFLHPPDLAKFAELLFGGGVYGGKRVLREESAREMLTLQTRGGASPINLENAETMGLGWFLMPMPGRTFDAATERAWRRAGVPEANLRKMAPYRDRVFPFFDYECALYSLFGVTNCEDPEVARPRIGAKRTVDLYSEAKPVVFAFSHSGSGGQYLVGLPTRRLAAVRYVGLDEAYNEDSPTGYGEFEADVYGLVRYVPPPLPPRRPREPGP